MLLHQFRDDAPYQLGSSYGMKIKPLSLGNTHTSTQVPAQPSPPTPPAPQPGNRIPSASEAYILPSVTVSTSQGTWSGPLNTRSWLTWF